MRRANKYLTGIATFLWNSLDKDLKLSKNHRDFKQKLRQILLHKFLDPASVS